MSLTDRIAALTPEQRALFEKLRETKRQAARAHQPPPVRRLSGPDGAGDWPLSLDQERYWFMEQLRPSGAGLNLGTATRMRGPLSVPALAAAFAEILRRHAAWRTTFPVLDGAPVQRVAGSRRQRLAVVDVSGLPEVRREAEALRLVGEDAAAPFDLERGPLVRTTLIRLSPRDHVCLLTAHHLVVDFLAFQIVWAELGALYAAFAADGPPRLPEPPVHYSDFAVWQREWLQGEVLADLVSWWRERLEGFPLALDLPTDRPRPAVMRMRGGRRLLNVSRELSEALRTLARQEGATLFMTVLATLAALLHRDSGQERLILGANNANRNRPEIQPVVGTFLTQVPFPLDLAGDPTCRELLARVRQSALGTYAHQDLSFGKLVEAIQPQRDTSRQPIIQTLVQVLDGQPQRMDLAGVTFESIDAYDGNARYDLLLTLFDHPAGLSGSLEYDADLFDPATAGRLCELLLLQAAAATADPDLRLSALPVLTPAARHQVLAEWSDTARPLPDWTVPERFAGWAARAPDALAVAAAGEELTFGELDLRAEELAGRLRAAGVGPESRVALLLDRTAEMPVALLGVWKAGGACVPLDPASPPERLEALLADCDPTVVVHPGLRLEPSSPSHEGVQEGGRPRPEHLAYMIYTSGTTGLPKAVMVEHGGLAAVLDAVAGRFGFAAGDRMPHLARFSFDISLFELFAPLLGGGACEILQQEEVLEPAALLAALERATRFHAVPSLMRQVAASARAAGPERFAGLRTLFTGGDLVPPDLLVELGEVFPGAEVVVLYGPTEGTIVCTSHSVAPEARPERTLIGRPFANAGMRVIDRWGDAPLGVPGELWIGGPGVARGYFRRDELTAERFVEREGRRYYRSGDLVRHLADGTLEFLGRTDLQVKVRGFRVEPGEVEAALLAHPAVREAVVVARGNRLVAYLVAGAAPPVEEIRAFLRTRLPEYMVPGTFVPLAALPLSPNGKVDRKALPAPEPAGEASGGSTPPRDAREERLAAIWRGVLRLERVGVHDNFFQLGGDSILSIQVVARARREGLLITPQQLFENQTIAGLAAVAGSVEEAGVAEGPVEGDFPLAGLGQAALDRVVGNDPGVEDLYPLAPMQQGMLFHSLYTAGADLYVEQLTAELAGPFDQAAFIAAWRRVVERHPALRTGFLWQEVEPPLQLVRRRAELPWTAEDWRGVPPAALESRWRDLLAADRARGFDLGRPPLLRITLVRVGEEEHRLVWSSHHLLFDGWCFPLLLSEVFALYAAAVAGREAHLPPPPRPYRDYIAWLAERDQAAAERYWRRALAGFTVPTPAPFDRPAALGGAEGNHAGDYYERTLTLPASRAAGLESLAQRLQVTLNTLVQGAWALLLSRYAQASEVVFGAVVSGRPAELAGVESMVGLFINSLPVRVEIPEGEAASSWLARLQAGQFEQSQYAWTPLARIQALSEVPTGEPLFTSLLAFQNYPLDPAVSARLNELRISDVALSERTNYPLTLSAVARGELALRLTADRRFEPATIRRMLAHLDNLLGALAADPERPPRSLPLLATAERHQLTVEWSDTARPLPEWTVPGRFADQAAATPEALALVAGGESLTFAALDGRTEELARRLRAAGVATGSRVALLLDRTAEMPAALLAVWKAGGVCVPLDPASPAERLASLLADAEPAVVIHRGLRIETFLPAAPGGSPEGGLPRPEHLAYMIYTSGTTGLPKAVMVEHGGLAAVLAAVLDRFSFGPGDRMPHLARFSFDISLLELFAPLLGGGACEILDQEEILDPAALMDTLARATRFHAVPSLMRQVAAAARESGPERFAGLRTLFTGGDRVPPDLLAELGEVFPAAEIVVLYGPTEATIVCTYYPVPPGAPLEKALIGRPFDNVEVRVVDRGEDLPPGAPGELWIGGPGVARGYFRREELTADRFVEREGRRYYRTGDLVRRLADGTLEFLGRTDLQVKIRGFRVEPGEIETAARGASGSAGGGGGGARRQRSGRTARGLRRRRGRGGAGRGAPGLSARPPAGVHGARGRRRPARAAAHRQRQGGPQVPARAGVGRRGERRLDPAPGCPGGAAGRDLARGARPRAGGGPRQLLPARRRLDPEHPGGGAGSPGGAPHHPPAAVREPDDRRARRRRRQRGRGRGGRRGAGPGGGAADADPAPLLRRGAAGAVALQPGGGAHPPRTAGRGAAGGGARPARRAPRRPASAFHARGRGAGGRSTLRPRRCRFWSSTSRPCRRRNGGGRSKRRWSICRRGSTSRGDPCSRPRCSALGGRTGCSSPPITWWSTASPGACCWRIWRPPTGGSSCRRRPPPGSAGRSSWLPMPAQRNWRRRSPTGSPGSPGRRCRSTSTAMGEAPRRPSRSSSAARRRGRFSRRCRRSTARRSMTCCSRRSSAPSPPGPARARCGSTSKGMGARRSSPASTSRAPSAGSPPSFRSPSRCRRGEVRGRRSREPRRACGRSPAAGWATACCVTWPRRRRASAWPRSPRRRSPSTISDGSIRRWGRAGSSPSRRRRPAAPGGRSPLAATSSRSTRWCWATACGSTGPTIPAAISPPPPSGWRRASSPSSRR